MQVGDLNNKEGSSRQVEDLPRIRVAEPLERSVNSMIAVSVASASMDASFGVARLPLTRLPLPGHVCIDPIREKAQLWALALTAASDAKDEMTYTSDVDLQRLRSI